MSYLGTGSECSTARNPLSQFAKHATQDRSLQQDRFGTIRDDGMPNPASGMHSQQRVISTTDRQLYDTFVNGSTQLPDARSHSQTPPSLGGNGPPAAAYEGLHHQPQVQQQSNWGADFHQSQQNPRLDPGWSREFSQSVSSPVPAAVAATSTTLGGHVGYMPSAHAMPQMSYMHAQHHSVIPSDGKGKERMVELDDQNWEEQFRQIELEDRTQDEVTAESRDNVMGEEDMLDKIETIPTEATSDQDPLDHAEFESIWKNIQDQVAGNHEMRDEANSQPAWQRQFDEYTTNRPEFGDYQFELDNPYLTHPDPFTEGCRLMESGANLSEAALAFEASCQLNPEHVESWSKLGSVQAQNEKEDPAIRALERAVKLDPGNEVALMSLSVSYTNEQYENAAYVTLERWLATKYPDIVNQARAENPDLGNEDRFHLQQRVAKLFIRAAQMAPEGMAMDPDVQSGLGVIFYGNEEYDKAIDCFQAALSVRPDDPLLWNRLGATLANSHRSEEAIEAYYRALEIRPSFVRARYNLGVSCINIGVYHEAAGHLLGALAMHKAVDRSDDSLQANQSTNLLDTLRRVFLGMGRKDLVQKVQTGMDLNEFRSEFDF